MSVNRGFYISPSLYHRSRLYSAINPNYEDDIGHESEYVNDYVKGMTRNNAFFFATKRAYRKGVSGAGFNIQSKTRIKYKESGQEVIFDKEFERLIRQWSKKQGGVKSGRSNCEITGRFYFEKAQRVLVDEYAVTSGGYIIAHHISKAFKYGYKFEIIPLQLIDTSKHMVSERRFNGFELDANGEITHIWIFRDATKTTSKRIPYKNLTLSVNTLFDPTQYSGVSPLAPVLEALEYIDSYKATKMDEAKKRARNPIMVGSPYFAQLTEALIKEQADEVGIENVDRFEIAKTIHNMKRLDAKEKTVSDFAYISDDEKVTELGKAVEDIYDFMYRNESRSAAAGVGLNSSTTSGEIYPSYNATLKASKDEEAELKIIAQDIVEDSLREMVEVWLLNGLVLKGLLAPPKYWENPDLYRDTRWLREERGHIDPVKTAKALTENITVNQTLTMPSALAQMNIDYMDYLDERDEYDEALHQIQMKKLKRELEKKKAFNDLGVEYVPSDGGSNTMSTITDLDLMKES